VSEPKPLFDDPSGTNPLQPMEEDMPDQPYEHPSHVSPTGLPVVAGTAILLKLGVVLVALAGVALTMDFLPATQIDEKIAGAVIAIGAALGIASPGVRK
jgi:hypothetical protein